MEIRASIDNAGTGHRVQVSTDGRTSSVVIAAKAAGNGSSINGGELLCLALATCYCNDVYREAAAQGVIVTRVVVDVTSEFGGPGEPARRISYCARVESDAPEDVIERLLAHTDRVAEIHNTLRAGIAVERIGSG